MSKLKHIHVTPHEKGKGFHVAHATHGGGGAGGSMPPDQPTTDMPDNSGAGVPNSPDPNEQHMDFDNADGAADHVSQLMHDHEQANQGYEDTPDTFKKALPRFAGR
jgi:hypothetical protein